MRELKVGDRVAVYIAGVRRVGKICGVMKEDEQVRVQHQDAQGKSDGSTMLVHRKQCRALLKSTRRHWLLRGNDFPFSGVVVQGPALRGGEKIEVVEVRRRA